MNITTTVVASSCGYSIVEKLDKYTGEHWFEVLANGNFIAEFDAYYKAYEYFMKAVK